MKFERSRVTKLENKVREITRYEKTGCNAGKTEVPEEVEFEIKPDIALNQIRGAVVALHSENAERGVFDGGVQGSGEAESKDQPRVCGVDDAVIPEARA